MDEALLEHAMRLTPADKLRLIDALYGSLDKPDAELDNAWYDEAEKRLEAHKAGNTQGIPAEKVLGPRP